jgi:synaptobrevin family protein YKT6
MNKRQAYALLDIVTHRFEEQYPFWDDYETDQTLYIEGVDQAFIESYKDAVSVVQQDLNETREHLVEALDALLQRGERLDALTERSTDLAARTRTFRVRTGAINTWWFWFVECTSCVWCRR